MDRVDLNELRERAENYRTRLEAVRVELSHAEEENGRELHELCCCEVGGPDCSDYIRESSKYESTISELESRLVEVINVLSAQRIPLGSRTFDDKFLGENFRHRHPVRYEFHYRRYNREWDSGTETLASTPICERVFDDGRIEPNPACPYVSTDADDDLLKEIAAAELCLLVAVQEKDAASRDWKRFQKTVRDFLQSPAAQKSAPSRGNYSNAADGNKVSQDLADFKQQLLDSGLPKDIVDRKLQELRQKIRLD